MTQHRESLKELSAKLKTDFTEENPRVNECLYNTYANGEKLIFRTFEEWAKLGYRVKKGAKAFDFWGTPQEFEIRNKKNPSKVDGVGSYCPIIFKFSENQVFNTQNNK